MQKLIALVEKHLGASWVAIVEELRDNNELDDVAARLHRDDVNGAIQGVEDAAKAFAEAQAVAFEHAGKTTAEAVSDNIGSVVRFDMENAHAVAWAEKNQAELVRDITEEQRQLIRRVVADGVRAGRNPREVAKDLRDSIGLTDSQAQVVANYRRALESGDWDDALGRELSDGRTDRTIRAARDAGRALTDDQIDTAVERYRQNWVNYRATTIGRTEALRVAHQGTEELFRQAIDNGDVEADELVREWHHAASGRPRESHVEMNGQTRAFGEAFESGSGARLMYPGDPDAGPAETINCRCCVSTQITA